ncbi:ATP-binding protein [Bradyrhizobium ottawaense]|uniref:ATP-binding protein n=1 Tax=Bradyrhizobium ottawaense TaxID=931866 RepID=UPI00384CA639
MERLIVFGVSGVGKTTACLGYVARHPRYLLLSASALIASATGATLKSLRTASAQQLLANQDILQLAVDNELRKRGASSFILDGQCVLDNGREIVTLPAEAIRPFRPTGLILLEASATEIANRRSQDARQRPFRTVKELSEQLAQNRDAVRDYAMQLEIPFVCAEAKGAFSLDKPLEALAGSL